MTENLDDDYGVEIEQARLVGPKMYTAKGRIFDRTVPGSIGKEVTGQGTTSNRAQKAAKQEAIRALPELRRRKH